MHTHTDKHKDTHNTHTHTPQTNTKTHTTHTHTHTDKHKDTHNTYTTHTQYPLQKAARDPSVFILRIVDTIDGFVSVLNGKHLHMYVYVSQVYVCMYHMFKYESHVCI